MLPHKVTLRSGLDGGLRNLQAWIDSVQNILARGFRVADQIGPLVTGRWSTTAADTTTFRIPDSPSAPLSICILRATHADLASA